MRRFIATSPTSLPMSRDIAPSVLGVWSLSGPAAALALALPGRRASLPGEGVGAPATPRGDRRPAFRAPHRRGPAKVESADLREGRGRLLRGEARDLALERSGEWLALGHGPLRVAEDRRHAGGQGGQRRGVRSAAPDRACGQACDRPGGGGGDHGGAGVGTDRGVPPKGSPVATVRRRLPKRAGGPKHYDALHFSQVASALARIGATNCAPSTKRAIPFTALTAARQVEVRRATWDQFDLKAAVAAYTTAFVARRSEWPGSGSTTPCSAWRTHSTPRVPRASPAPPRW